MRAVDLLGGAEILSVSECWDILASEEVGRLAVVAKGKPDIVPVNFECDGRSIVIHSNLGHKLLSAGGSGPARRNTRSGSTHGGDRSARLLSPDRLAPMINGTFGPIPPGDG